MTVASDRPKSREWPARQDPRRAVSVDPAASAVETGPPQRHPTRDGLPLGQLVADLEGELDLPAQQAATRVSDVRITGVQQDSRWVVPGDLFVALCGQSSDGVDYAAAAVERGAVAVLLDRGRRPGLTVPTVGVADPRVAMARAAALVYGRPSEALTVVGITGTNGKTTSAHVMETCLRGCGLRPAVVGTLGYFFEGYEHPSTHTSPEADELQRVAASLLDRGATHLVMEVSSIALAADRVAEMDFDVGVFTNLSQDHLDYHGTMAVYGAAKERLFFHHQPPLAVVNVDDPFGAELARKLAAADQGRVIRVSLHEPVEVHAAEVRLVGGGMELALVVNDSPAAGAGGTARRYELTAPFTGTFNVSNVLCAVAVVHALGLDVAAALEALVQAEPVPGRLERCDEVADDVVALVDYAHTPGALERVLESIRPAGGARLWCVFGCGGDRDADKRAPMGEAVARGADVAIVTNDNPRSESPEAIAAAVVAGLERGGAADVRVQLDRAQAIDQAVQQAAPGDVVLVAGKGHEPYQIVGTEVADFDDRVKLRESLRRRRGRGGA